MPVTVQCQRFPLTRRRVSRLWREVISLRRYSDDSVAVRCVSERASSGLHKRYQGKRGATNVLTFSYTGAPTRKPTHDVALCLTIVKAEARARGATLADYAALVLAHAFLHATGMDHARAGAARTFARAERMVLRRCGFRLAAW